MTDTSPARIAALDALIAAVEAGKGGDGVGYYAARVFNPGYAHAVNAYHGSFDAARALHDAVLPGWRVGNLAQAYGYPTDSPDCWTCWIVSPSYLDDCDQAQAKAPNPARAWLLAILRALKSQVNHD